MPALSVLFFKDGFFKKRYLCEPVMDFLLLFLNGLVNRHVQCSVSISNMVNIDSYNSHEQKLFRLLGKAFKVLVYFILCYFSWDQKGPKAKRFANC